MSGRERVRSSHKILVGNILAGAAGFFVPAALLLVSYPILISIIGSEALGVFQIGQAIGGGMTFADLGMTSATVFFVARHRASQDYQSLGHVVATSLVCLYLIAIPIALAILVGAPQLVACFRVGPATARDAEIVFRLVAVQLTLMPITSIAVAYFKGLQRFGTSTAIVVGASVATWGVAVVAGPLFSLSLATLAWLFAAGNALSAAAAGALILVDLWSHGLAPAMLAPKLSMFRTMWRYSSAVFAQGLVIFLNTQFLRLIVGAMFGPSSVTVYSAAVNLTTKVHAAIAAGVEALFPYVASTNDRDHVRRVYRRMQIGSVGCGAAILLPLGLFAHSLGTLWLGAKLGSEAAPLIRALSFATICLVGNIAPYYLINAMHRPWLNFSFMILALLTMAAVLLFSSSTLTLLSFVIAFTASQFVIFVGTVVSAELLLIETGATPLRQAASDGNV